MVLKRMACGLAMVLAGLAMVLAGLAQGGAARAQTQLQGLTTTPGFVTFSTWLRAGPTQWSKELDELPGGWPVGVLSCADGWCKVLSDGEPGFLPQTLISASRAPDKVPEPGAACLPATHQTPEGEIALRICPAAPGPAQQAPGH